MVLGVIRMSERLQIEGPKLGRLRNKRCFTSADQCECYYFHIFAWMIRRLAPIDNCYFLWPITKADVSLPRYFLSVNCPLSVVPKERWHSKEAT